MVNNLLLEWHVLDLRLIKEKEESLACPEPLRSLRIIEKSTWIISETSLELRGVTGHLWGTTLFEVATFVTRMTHPISCRTTKFCTVRPASSPQFFK